ncbi:VC0807 family protein [Kribbella sp. NPDC058245]|uniref:VC0807 family protein n=1 Tax=Kribbella sp. NPDC058245 TaxID=3346399 RepID=UPI0036E5D946
MPEPTKRQKIIWISATIANLAVDLLLPTLILVALAPTGLPAALRLSIGGALLSGKAIGGRIESGEFRWRFALLAGLVPAAAIVGCHLAGAGTTASMVAGAVVAGVIVIADLARNRMRAEGRRIDAFAVLVLIEVLVSIVVTSISGDARFVLARTSLYLAVGGIFALATTWTDRPMMRSVLKPVAAKGDPERAEAFERVWTRSREFRGLYRAMTFGLGVVFLADAVLRVVIIYSQPADDITQTSLTSQAPLIVLLLVWFAASRALAVPRAERLLDAEAAVPR